MASTADDKSEVADAKGLITSYEAYVHELKAKVSNEDFKAVLKEARERWLFFEKEYNFWLSTQNILPGLNSVDVGWKTIAARDIRLTRLYAALIKHEILCGASDSAHGKGILKFFEQISPSWFRPGSKFTMIVDKLK